MENNEKMNLRIMAMDYAVALLKEEISLICTDAAPTVLTGMADTIYAWLTKEQTK